jgi:hypothetical protein
MTRADDRSWHFSDMLTANRCPILGLDRTWPNDAAMSQIGPKSDMPKSLRSR